jgi:ribosomal protein S18 acetylase RimI-like enzyme
MGHLQARPYVDLDDLARIKALNREGRRFNPLSSYLHNGDLDWWLFYGDRNENWSEMIWLWEDQARTLVGWVMLRPKKAQIEMAVRPSLRGGEVEDRMLAWSEARLNSYSHPRQQSITTFAFVDEAERIALLHQRAYQDGDDELAFFAQALTDELPAPVLPDGYHFLDAMRPELAAPRAAVHFDAFTPSKMTTEAYINVMTAPHYDPTLDVVIVAPDGTFAAFAMTWADSETGIGYFEPVGTRRDCQRRGLGRAALYEGMRRLRARGMKLATVFSHTYDVGNLAFYQAAGFNRVNTVRRYTKGVNV